MCKHANHMDEIWELENCQWITPQISMCSSHKAIMDSEDFEYTLMFKSFGFVSFWGSFVERNCHFYSEGCIKLIRNDS